MTNPGLQSILSRAGADADLIPDASGSLRLR